MVLRSLAAAVSISLIAGCLAPPAGSSERLADAANDLNMATRFGRMNAALEHVAPESKDEFTKKHEPWGRDVWIVDLELLDVVVKSKDEASVILSVLWQRPTEAELRTTQITQSWKDDRRGWRMISEQKSGGDAGLLEEKGEKKAERDGASKPLRASFQTRVIRAAE
ncbi:MAG TPA: hypothetical protein VK459_07895 [Polyangiaceae bacterium]|nr:hypothetical protein [Polyangiaceae bacterium]